MLYHRRPAPIALPFCLSCAALCIVAEQCKIGLKCVESNRNVPFSTPKPTLIPQTWGAIEGGIIWHWKSGQTASDRANVCIERH